MLIRLEDMRAQPTVTGGIDTGHPGQGGHIGRIEWMPAVDLGEIENAILIRVELPGVRSDQVRLTLRDQVLRVEGRKDRPTPQGARAEDRPVRFLCLERSYGSFAFDISLKWQIEAERVSARMVDGILEIRLPKAGLSNREIVIPVQS